MPPALCTVSGIVYDVEGSPAPGVNIYIARVTLSDTIIESYQRLAATSNEDGEIEFTIPRDSVAWISGNFYVGSSYFNVEGGLTVVIPDSATADLEDLGIAVTTPSTQATVTALATETAARIAADLTKQPIATGTPNGSKFLRDDNSWQTPAGGAGSWGGITGTLGDQTDLQTALNLKAPLASPAFTDVPTAPTAAAATNTTQLATTAFVRTEVANLVASAPGALDTLDELAAALGDDANFATTVTNSLALKANLAGANVFTALQTAQGLTTTSPGWYAQLTGDSVPRVRVGLNATDAASIGFGGGAGTRDLFLERAGAANLRLGAIAVDTAPVAQTLSVQNTLAGGTSNVAGANLTIAGSQGKGTGVGGSIIFQVAPAGSTGTTVNSLAIALTIDSTKSASIARGLRIGDTSTAFLAQGQLRISDGTSDRALFHSSGTAGQLWLNSTGSIAWDSIAAAGNGIDTFLSRPLAGVLQVGTSAANALGTIFAARHQVATSVFWSSGTGTPEGAVTANIGSLFSRTDGGAGTSFYVKESGNGTANGWVAK